MNIKKIIATVLTLSSLATPVCLSASAENFCKKTMSHEIKLKLNNGNDVILLDKFFNIYPFQNETIDNTYKNFVKFLYEYLKNAFTSYYKFQKSNSEQECEKNYDAMIGNFTIFELYGKKEYMKKYLESEGCFSEACLRDFDNLDKEFYDAFNIYLKLYGNYEAIETQPDDHDSVNIKDASEL